MGILDSFLKPFVKLSRLPIESFIRLETSDSEHSFAAEDGSLVSVVRVDGSCQIIGDDEYHKILSDCIVKFGTRFDSPGHALQVYFVRNPDRVAGNLKERLKTSRKAAKDIGLEIDDIFEERSHHLCNYLAWEEIYFVLWTRPSILTKADFEREAAHAKERKWVRAPDAQFPFAAVEALRTRHASFTNAITMALQETGIQSELLEVHDALSAIRANLFQANIHKDWRACLPGDKTAPRAPEKHGDLSSLLWPSLPRQLSTSSARVINDHVVQMGKYLWGGVDMTLGPQDPLPFPALLARLSEGDVPFRISFLIESGGIQGMAAQAFLSSIFSVTNAENKQIKNSLEMLTALARSEPVVKLRVSFATWAPKDNMNLLEERLSALMQAVESWGYCQVSQLVGDPLDCVMSSAAGIACASTAPPGVAPLYEVLKMLPWQRAASPFLDGAILFRTPDGRAWPYQTGTNVTTTWFDLIFAQPGGGKSVLMNTLNLGTCLTPGLSNLPFIAVIDIGPSSAGLISLIKDALPPHRKHEAVSFRLQMNQDYAINPFDTKLGMRHPQVTERSFLIEMLTIFCTPPGQEDPYDGISQLSGLVIDEMYRWRDDSGANAEPRPYLPRIDPEVDEALRAHNLNPPPSAYWWDVVDLLFENDLTYAASLAQRYTSPTLGDAVAAARRPQIRNLLDETSIGGSTEGVIHAFERMITSAVREFPILSSVTRFSLAENRVCSLDLADVCPQGDATANRQTAIMYMLARHALVTPWWINEEALIQMPVKYRTYHEKRLREFAETPKRLCYDEFHRTSSSKSVRGQVVRDVREGRKRGIQIVLSSQMLHDFDDDMVDLSTGVWVLGTAISDSAVDATQSRFGLTDTARWIIRHKLTGPKSSGAPCLLVLGTTDGKYEQHLINTLGPIELWAFSTSSEDVLLRSKLYARVGASSARKLLATFFPGGSARSEIRRRILEMAEKSEDGEEKASIGTVVDLIVNELIDSVKVNVEDIEITIKSNAGAEPPTIEDKSTDKKDEKSTGTAELTPPPTPEKLNAPTPPTTPVTAAPIQPPSTPDKLTPPAAPEAVAPIQPPPPPAAPTQPPAVPEKLTPPTTPDTAAPIQPPTAPEKLNAPKTPDTAAPIEPSMPIPGIEAPEIPMPPIRPTPTVPTDKPPEKLVPPPRPPAAPTTPDVAAPIQPPTAPEKLNAPKTPDTAAPIEPSIPIPGIEAPEIPMPPIRPTPTVPTDKPPEKLVPPPRPPAAPTAPDAAAPIQPPTAPEEKTTPETPVVPPKDTDTSV